MKLGDCPYCKRKEVRLLKHHLDYKTNLVVYMCKECHYKEHFPEGKRDRPVLPGNISNRQIMEIDDSGHFGRMGGGWEYISRERIRKEYDTK